MQHTPPPPAPIGLHLLHAYWSGYSAATTNHTAASTTTTTPLPLPPTTQPRKRRKVQANAIQHSTPSATSLPTPAPLRSDSITQPMEDPRHRASPEERIMGRYEVSEVEWEDAEGGGAIYTRDVVGGAEEEGEVGVDGEVETAAEAPAEAAAGETPQDSLNDAWVAMFVESERKRTEKKRRRQEDARIAAMKPVEREDEKQHTRMVALYGEEAALELQQLETRLHATYEARVKAKTPHWPSTPLNFVDYNLVSNLVDVGPIMVQTRTLCDSEQKLVSEGAVPEHAFKAR